MNKIVYLRQWTKERYEREYIQLIKDIDFMIETMLQQDIDVIDAHLGGKYDSRVS